MTGTAGAGKLTPMSWWRRQRGQEASGATEPVVQPTPRRGDAEERYRAADVVAIPAGGGEALAYRRGCQSSHLLPESAVDFLRRCTTFRTLDDHCRELIRDLRLDASLHDPVRDELEQLATLGLLTTHGQIYKEAVAAHGAEKRPAPRVISTVAVVTCDRPDAAMRCVTSVIEAARRHGRSPAIVVSDDSRDAANAARLHEALERRRAEYPAITHIGRGERAQLSTALASAIGDDRGIRETIQFALFGDPGQITPGASRNALLLHRAGKPFVSLDDDTLCRVAPAPGLEDGLSLSSLPDPSQFWFYPDRQVALADPDWQPVDPLALHDRFLGRTAAACIAALEDPGGLDLDDADGPLLSRVGAGDRVAVTTTGLAGDSGMVSPTYYFTLRGPSRERLLADYATFRESRAVVRTVTRPTLSTGGFLMTPCVGLDTTNVLPPFLPVGRNEDGVFAQALRTVSPDALVGHLPWAIYHDPPETRGFAPDARHAPLTTLSLAQAIILCLSAAPLGRGGDPATRLERAGRLLRETASLADGDLLELLYLQRLAQIGHHLAHLDESLHLYGGRPPSWADDLNAAIAASRSGLNRPEDLLPVDPGDSTTGRLGAVRDLLHRFGLLLEAWPALFEAALCLSVP